MESLIEKTTPLFQKYKLPLGLGILGMILFGYGLISSFHATPGVQDIQFTPGNDAKSEQISDVQNKKSVEAAKTMNEITVDVSGAVISPGVYQLPFGSRVKDAVDKAGGISDEADKTFLEKQFNFAAKIQDGSKIYVPREGEGYASTASNGSTNSVSGDNTVSSQIDINTASDSELDSLPGVGKVTAQKIIDNRPYAIIEDLTTKKVVSASVFEKIKDKIVVY